MSLAYSLWGVVFTSVFVVRCFILVLVLVAISISFSPNFSLVGMIIKPKCYNYNKMLFITLHRILTNRNEVTMVILLRYTSAFSKVIYATFMLKFLIEIFVSSTKIIKF